MFLSVFVESFFSSFLCLCFHSHTFFILLGLGKNASRWADKASKKKKSGKWKFKLRLKMKGCKWSSHRSRYCS